MLQRQIASAMAPHLSQSMAKDSRVVFVELATFVMGDDLVGIHEIVNSIRVFEGILVLFLHQLEHPLAVTALPSSVGCSSGCCVLTPTIKIYVYKHASSYITVTISRVRWGWVPDSTPE